MDKGFLMDGCASGGERANGKVCGSGQDERRLSELPLDLGLRPRLPTVLTPSSAGVPHTHAFVSCPRTSTHWLLPASTSPRLANTPRVFSSIKPHSNPSTPSNPSCAIDALDPVVPPRTRRAHSAHWTHMIHSCLLGPLDPHDTLNPNDPLVPPGRLLRAPHSHHHGAAGSHPQANERTGQRAGGQGHRHATQLRDSQVLL